MRRQDLVALGIHPRRIRRWTETRRLRELHPGVFTPGAGVLPRRSQFLAAQWWAGEGAALSHHSAAALHGWIVEPPDARIHLATHRSRFSEVLVVHRTKHLERRDVVGLGRLWVTSDARTLIDLADVLEYDELRRVADRLKELPLARLAAERERLNGRRGAGRTKRLLESEQVRTKSELERRYVRYCTAYGVPHPSHRNHWVGGHKADCVHEAERLVVELDGRAHHERRAQLREDHRRDADYQLAGYRILRLTWEELALGERRAAAVVQRFLAGV